MAFTSDDPEGQARVLAFAQALQQLGWMIGQNLRIDTRWGAGDVDRNRRYAAELLALEPDVILANGGPELRPLQQATHKVPIVFANVADPVGQGFVATLSHPGSNITGFLNFEFSTSGKWLELLKEIAPRTARVAVLLNRSFVSGVAQLAAVQVVASTLGVEVRPIDFRDPSEI